ncbi:hypothetical protein HSX11_21850 [Oxalobacteraceae bacterium]|nr:hypothetical protein [Oxalobacteraceae bacterium]
MRILDALRTAIDGARHGRDSLFQYRFPTPEGEVGILAEIVLDGDTIVCEDVCVYAISDPPGIRKSTISKELRSELRELLASGQKLGFPAMRIRGVRVPGSSSAKAGKIVDIKRRRKR